ncbi:hypothetical protein GOBAR_AA30555 [Gossypium barbadense]|uniref:DUF4283 domain-containing protein n=1 Tax=Gossypium barbadense TaxID=3634 RepID=A0A2P5WGB8_GOSBA|nr:hypothetical protein GOBAR_AA30555 [Gossypium barbadense]
MLVMSNAGNNSQPQATQVGGRATKKAFEDDDIELHEGDAIRGVVNGIPLIHFLDWLMDLENGYYMAKFMSEDDCANVLAEVPWVVFGQYLTVQSWTPLFSTSEMFPLTLVVWVRFSGHMYKESVLKAIGESIGWIVKIDDNTENRTIGQFARLAVCFNLTKPLVLKVSVENHTQRVEYESLPYNCYKLWTLRTYKGEMYGRDNG